jgi:ceramide glucosyltransferase
MLSAVLVTLCTAATLFSIASVYLITRRRDPVVARAAPVSVLKPLCGLDDALESNLESFFLQRYPDFELVFGAESPRDPALAVVERLRARYPGVRARVVVHGRRGLNAKVANLRGMLADEAGASDLVVVSDSNVGVGPDYLAGMVAELAQPGVGLVTSLFAGASERTLGARLESLHLCGPVAGSIAASEVGGGSAVCVGKSMAFRRSELESLGGLESVSTVLAEDYVIGRMYKEAGYRVRLSPEVVRNVTMSTTLGRFVDRQLRWALLRSRLSPLRYPVELLVNPIAIALLAMLLGAGAWTLAWAAALTALRDGAQWLRLRGRAGLARALPWGVAKDMVMLGVFAVAPFLRGISWRGHALRVSAGTRVYAARSNALTQRA